MIPLPEIETRIFDIKDDAEFNNLALSLFNYHYSNNPVYKEYVDLIRVNISRINHYKKIPFLPISFFKTHKVYTQDSLYKVLFLSSTTTGDTPSKHYVYNENLYVTSFEKNFENIYGKIEDFTFLALLPNYLERGNSSLVFMMKHLIEKSKHKESGFFLNDFEKLNDTIETVKNKGGKCIIIGVTYALLDFAQEFPNTLNSNFIVMETGGMKGKRREITRFEVHDFLKNKFNLKIIHSEYGMTELLSQSYLFDSDSYKTPSWMKVFSRDIYDPFQLLPDSQTGLLSIIDLANIYSCPFIATDDIAKTFSENRFTVIGRHSVADLRGCNLMVE